MQFTEPPRAFVRMNSLNALSFKRDHFLIDNKILLHFTTQSTRTRLTFDEFRTFIAMRKKLEILQTEQLSCWNDWIELFYHKSYLLGLRLSLTLLCDGGVSLPGEIIYMKLNVENYRLKWKNWYVWWIIIWLQQQQRKKKEGNSPWKLFK